MLYLVCKIYSILYANNLKMLSRLTERKIAQLFYIVGVREQEIEKSRETLCLSLDFETYTSFRFLDSEKRGSLSAADFEQFLIQNRRPLNYASLQLLINQYDTNLDGRLSINEFSKFVLPNTNELLRDTVSLRTPYTSFSIETQFLLLRLIELEMSFHEEVEKIRFEITSQSDFGLLDSFRALDINRSSAIDKPAIRGMMSRNSFYLSESEISGILRRFDTDGDGCISYVEYVDAIMPKKPRGSSPIRRSPAKGNSTEAYIRIESPSRSLNGFRSSPLRNSSPLRKSSPSRDIQRSMTQDSPSRSQVFKQESPSRISPSRIRNYMTETSINPRASSPLRKSSPLRSSPIRMYEGVSNTNTSYFRAQRDSPPRTLNCFTISENRRTSPLRYSPSRISPSRGLGRSIEAYSPTRSLRFSPVKSVDIRPNSPLRRSPIRSVYNPVRGSEDIIPQRVGSPLKSMPLRNAPLREAASRESPFRSY